MMRFKYFFFLILFLFFSLLLLLLPYMIVCYYWTFSWCWFYYMMFAAKLGSLWELIGLFWYLNYVEVLCWMKVVFLGNLLNEFWSGRWKNSSLRHKKFNCQFLWVWYLKLIFLFNDSELDWQIMTHLECCDFIFFVQLSISRSASL